MLLLPILSNCTQYTAVLGPSITFAQTGSVAQATTTLSKSIAINKVKKEFNGKIDFMSIKNGAKIKIEFIK